MPRIFVVDDDWPVCSAIRDRIEKAGFKMVAADGAASGLKTLDDNACDLMTVDSFMPKTRGFDSVRLFQGAPGVPLVAVSGPAPEFLKLALESGASHCLKKPVRPTALLHVHKRLKADRMVERIAG